MRNHHLRHIHLHHHNYQYRWHNQRRYLLGFTRHRHHCNRRCRSIGCCEWSRYHHRCHLEGMRIVLFVLSLVWFCEVLVWDWDVSWPGEKTKTTAALVGGCPAVTQAAWHDERNSWNWHHRPHHMHHHHHQTGYYTAKKIKYYIIKLFKKKIYILSTT